MFCMHDFRCSKLIESVGNTFCRTKVSNLLIAGCCTKKMLGLGTTMISTHIGYAQPGASTASSLVRFQPYNCGRGDERITREGEKENIGRVARPVEPLESLDEGAGGWEITWTLVFGSTDRAVGKVPLVATN